MPVEAKELTVRPLTELDIDAISRIDARVSGTYRPEFWEERVAYNRRRDPESSRVAESGGRVSSANIASATCARPRLRSAGAPVSASESGNETASPPRISSQTAWSGETSPWTRCVGPKSLARTASNANCSTPNRQTRWPSSTSVQRSQRRRS